MTREPRGDGGPAAGTPMSGAEIFARCLVEEKVEVLFGYPGGATIGVYDVLRDLSRIQHVLTRHEQGATHAAEGYARVTGKPGVVLVTSGPGATNTVTGIADAYMDSLPLVVFTGQVALRLIGNDAFQEADIVGITRQITKHNYLVRDVTELAKTIKEAFHIATTGRPGPVLVDLPKDVMAQTAPFHYPATVEMRSYNPIVEGHQKQLKKAADVINGAKRPVLYVGGGTILSGAAKELTTLARKMSCPVTTTLQGLGAFPATDPLFMGMLGMHGTWHSNMAVHHCDVLIAVGARFDDRVTGKVEAFAPEATIIHIDIDPSAISKNVPVDVPIVGDVKRVLTDLIPLVKQLDTTDWQLIIAGWKREHPLRYKSGPEIRAQQVFHCLGEVTRGEAIVVTDVGQHQMWAAQFFPCMAPRTFVTSGGLGTMGFSLPAAMGVAFSHPRLPIVSISGDGGFQMNSQELTTIVQHKLPIKIFVINNGFLGMVRQWQDLFWKRRYSQVEMTSPDFVKLAEAHGCPAFRATASSEVEPLIRRAMEHKDGPVFVEFAVVQEDNVFPMIPAGQTVADMIDTPLDPADEGVTIFSTNGTTAAQARKEERRGIHNR